MKSRSVPWLLLALAAYGMFAVSAKYVTSSARNQMRMADSVVLPATFQTVLYLGDRYLAANIESTRVLMAGGEENAGLHQDYFHRLHTVVSDLNPCHEDNYYISNALLAWSGAVAPALDILSAATRCRFWDEMPPFFLGYNLYFFRHDTLAAKRLMFEAADRSPKNRAGFKKFGIMMEAETQPDAKAARNYLVSQRERTRDQKLRGMLSLRIGRLEGLIALRDAQTVFERRHGRKLEDPQDLLGSRILGEFPTDPLGIGYQFEAGQFSLRELNIPGMGNRRK